MSESRHTSSLGTWGNKGLGFCIPSPCRLQSAGCQISPTTSPAAWDLSVLCTVQHILLKYSTNSVLYCRVPLAWYILYSVQYILCTVLYSTHCMLYTISVLGQDEGYKVKYKPLPEGAPEGKAQGNS